MLLPNGVALTGKGDAANAHQGVLRESGGSVLRTGPALLARLRTADASGGMPRPGGRTSSVE